MAWEAEFDEFYRQFPRKVGRGDALKAYQQIMKKGYTPAELLAGLTRFVALMSANGTDIKFIPYPATWLRALRFADEAPAAPDHFQVSKGRGFEAYKGERAPSRPLLWFYQPKECWKPEWREDEIPAQYRATYEKLAAKRR